MKKEEVYLIGEVGTAHGFCKIGRALWPAFRLQRIDSPKLPFGLELKAQMEIGAGSTYVERQLHKHFGSRVVRGEWFRGIYPEEFINKALQFHQDYISQHSEKQ